MPQMGVGRKGGEPRIVHGLADGEMVEVLEGVAGQAEELMGHVVEETTHPGAAHPVGFGLQVKDLTDHPRFPVEVTVAPGRLFQGGTEPRDHGCGEGPVTGDLLAAAGKGRLGLALSPPQEEEGEGRCRIHTFPAEVRRALPPQFLQVVGASDQEVEPRLQTLHPVYEEEEMDPAFFHLQVEGGAATTEKGLVQDGEEVFPGEEGPAVEGEGTPPLADTAGRSHAGNLLLAVPKLRVSAGRRRGPRLDRGCRNFVDGWPGPVLGAQPVRHAGERTAG